MSDRLGSGNPPGSLRTDGGERGAQYEHDTDRSGNGRRPGADGPSGESRTDALLAAMDDQGVLDTAANICRDADHPELAAELQQRFGGGR